MNSEHFSHNLRCLRTEKGLTQEQLGQLLGVSIQSVSRWECGNTLPDVMLLPQIARLYGVTVDDLYRAEARAYPSYAQRLLAVYEASGKTEDFLAAEQEFSRTPAEKLTADDLRAWGVLYHYMTTHCARKAQQKLEQAMDAQDVTDRVYCSAAQQRLALLCDLGRGSEEAARYDRLLADNRSDSKLWLLCTAAHEFAGEYPRALELDCAFLHAVYSMGFCYEELGQYEEAYRVWTALAGELDRRGLTIERKYPAELADTCRKRIS